MKLIFLLNLSLRHFIGNANFHHNRSRYNYNSVAYKKGPDPEHCDEIFLRYLTSNAPPQFNFFLMLTVLTICTLFTYNFNFSEFLTLKDHRHSSYLDHGIKL
jgi:hypothetical protein